MKRHVLWGAFGLALFGLVSFGSGCDPEPDQCTDAIDRCENNVAFDCQRPGPEVHSTEVDTACSGENGTCFMGGDGHPFCGSGPATGCSYGGGICSPTATAISSCMPTLDGGFAYVDNACLNTACALDTSPGHADGGVVCK